MNKTTFGILTIIFNSIGIPCFLQGQTKAGVIRIILSCIPLAGAVFGTINLVLGILLGIEVLKMTEEEFQSKLGTLDKGWPKMIKEETAE